MKLAALFIGIYAVNMVLADPQSLSIIPNQEDNGDSDSDKIILNSNEETNLQDPNQESFQPTSEWQEVKPGQSVPRGLHMRMNLETGRNEAKLLANEDNQSETKFIEEDKLLSLKDIKKALREISKEDEILDSESLQTRKEKLQAKGLRSYEELKKEFGDAGLSIKSDMENIRDLLIEFNQSSSSNERKLAILADFEFLLHQVDNARFFVDIGGLDLLKNGLNHTESDFRESSAFVLAAAAQNNPPVQIAALERGFLHHLVQHFSTETNTDVRGRYLYAIGTLIRHFPFAQKEFVDLGGIDLFLDVLREQHSTLFYKHKIRVITVVSDLITEHLHAERNPESTNDKLIQYRQIPLVQYLLEKGWCAELPKLLEIKDFDVQEKVLDAMQLSVSFPCISDFGKERNVLSSLQRDLKKEIAQDQDGDYDFLWDMMYRVLDVLQSLPDTVVSERDEL